MRLILPIVDIMVMSMLTTRECCVVAAVKFIDLTFKNLLSAPKSPFLTWLQCILTILTMLNLNVCCSNVIREFIKCSVVTANRVRPQMLNKYQMWTFEKFEKP